MIANSLERVKTLVRRDRSSVFSTMLKDRGINPLDHFTDEEQAMRRELGDIAFGRSYEADGTDAGDLYLIPEINQDHFSSYDAVMSVPLIGLAPYEFGDALEVGNFDEEFELVSWDEGIRALEKILSENPDLAGQRLVRRIKEIDQAIAPNISLAAMRDRLGREAGGRLEVGLEN